MTAGSPRGVGPLLAVGWPWKSVPTGCTSTSTTLVRAVSRTTARTTMLCSGVDPPPGISVVASLRSCASVSSPLGPPPPPPPPPLCPEPISASKWHAAPSAHTAETAENAAMNVADGFQSFVLRMRLHSRACSRRLRAARSVPRPSRGDERVVALLRQLRQSGSSFSNLGAETPYMIRITVIPVARVVWEIRSAFSSTFVAVAPRTVTPRCGADRGAGDSCMPTITWDDFAKVDIRVGRILDVEDFPKARKPAYKLRIDFGELGVKTSSAQITKYYDKAELVGRLVLAVVNFPPRQIANFFSEVLTLGVVLGDGDIVLVRPEREVPP